jgi:hypothetical protein
MEDLGIKNSSGMGFDITDKGTNKILRLATTGADKYSVPAMDMAEYPILG